MFIEDCWGQGGRYINHSKVTMKNYGIEARKPSDSNCNIST